MGKVRMPSNDWNERAGLPEGNLLVSGGGTLRWVNPIKKDVAGLVRV